MEWGKRSYQEMSGGVDDEEHDTKRSSAIGGGDDEAIGGGDDEEHDDSAIISDDDADFYYHRYRCGYRYPSPERDYPLVKALVPDYPVYDLKTLDLHIKHFDTDPSIFEGLQKRVASGIDDQKTWFSELRKVWKGTESREEAGRLVLDVLYDIYPDGCNLCDMVGFLEHYGLPSLWKLEPLELTGIFGLPPRIKTQAPTN